MFIYIILYVKIQSVCVIVCVCEYVSMFVWNRLPNYAQYGDEAFAGDSEGLGLGQRLNSIFKKLILMYFWGKIAPDEKNTVYITSRSSANLCYEWRLRTNLTPLYGQRACSMNQLR